MDIPQKTLAAIFSNLAKASEKQQQFTRQNLFSDLAESVRLPGMDREVSLETVKSRIVEDLDNQYSEIQKKAEGVKDRGVQRALKWGQKVTTLQKSLIDQYLLKGDEYFTENNLFICEACGFIFLGTVSPDLCPICKAPKKRFAKVS